MLTQAAAPCACCPPARRLPATKAFQTQLPTECTTTTATPAQCILTSASATVRPTTPAPLVFGNTNNANDTSALGTCLAAPVISLAPLGVAAHHNSVDSLALGVCAANASHDSAPAAGADELPVRADLGWHR